MTATEVTCFLCGRESQHEDQLDRDIIVVSCNCCGVYHISEEATFQLEPNGSLSSQSDQRRLSGVMRERLELHDGRNITPILSSNIQALLSLAPEPFDVAGKVRKLLIALGRKSLHPGGPVPISEDADCSLAFASNPGEFLYLSEYATQQGWIERKFNIRKIRSGDPDLSVAPQTVLPRRDWDYTLTPIGWEEIAKSNHTESAKAFVAMWFSEGMDSAYESGIVPAISECGYRPVRIDAEEYNGDVVDQIIAGINESRFVVVDLTGHRNGAYFEAGYAKGLERDVIWTCREDVADKTHFDANHFNQIRWNTPEELREKLTNRIRAVIGIRPKLLGGLSA